MIPWVIEKDPSDFKRMLKLLEANHIGKNLPRGWVPDSTFWLVSEDGKVLVVNIRHSLTSHLRNACGHIGYGIRPAYRRKGYAAKMLELALKEAEQIGMEKVLIACDESNIASRKTIEKCGGVRDEDYIEVNGNVVNRFWIDLET